MGHESNHCAGSNLSHTSSPNEGMSFKGVKAGACLGINFTFYQVTQTFYLDNTLKTLTV